jgi:hypothetical protein
MSEKFARGQPIGARDGVEYSDLSPREWVGGARGVATGRAEEAKELAQGNGPDVARHGLEGVQFRRQELGEPRGLGAILDLLDHEGRSGKTRGGVEQCREVDARLVGALERLQGIVCARGAKRSEQGLRDILTQDRERLARLRASEMASSTMGDNLF